MSEPIHDPGIPDPDAPAPNTPDLDDGAEQSPPGDEPVERPDVEGQAAAAPSAAKDGSSPDDVADLVPPNNSSDADGTGTGQRPDLSGGGA